MPSLHNTNTGRVPVFIFAGLTPYSELANCLIFAASSYSFLFLVSPIPTKSHSRFDHRQLTFTVPKPSRLDDPIYFMQLHRWVSFRSPFLIQLKHRLVQSTLICCAPLHKPSSSLFRGHLPPAAQECLRSFLAQVSRKTISDNERISNGFTDGHSSSFSNIAKSSAILDSPVQYF